MRAAMRWMTVGLTLAVVVPRAWAFCGCDKPPPPRASVRPFAAWSDQTITLFDDRLDKSGQYTVRFVARDGSSDWSRAKAVLRRDFADGAYRQQLRVSVPEVPFGPMGIEVYDPDDSFVYRLADDQFTVIAPPIPLHDFAETVTRDGYQTGVGADGTVYFAFDTSGMTTATTYTGTAVGLGLRVRPEGVGIYNTQGFLGGGLDPKVPGLFRLTAGTSDTSDTLAYWRHEFRTYKEEHRKRDARRSADGEWHADGTPHVDNYHLVVAMAGASVDGKPLTPGATAPFRLVITSTPAPASDL